MPLLRPEDRETLREYMARQRRRRLPGWMKGEVLLAVAEGQPLAEVAERFRLGDADLRRLIRRYRKGGLQAIGLGSTNSQVQRPDTEPTPQGVATGVRPAGIVKTPGVCGGAARVEGTRIPVWQLVEERDLGSSDAHLLTSYPALRARDLVAAWDYADTNAEEIAEEIRENAGV